MMPFRRVRFRSLVPVALLCALLSLLASGCMWGVVRDVDTGAPIAGASVTVTDQNGQTLATTTDVNGLWGIGVPGAVAAVGSASFQVQAPGYDTVNETRTIDYLDNPNATFENFASFWDVQVFPIARPLTKYESSECEFSVSLPPEWTRQADVLGAGSVWSIAPANSPYYPSDIAVGCGPSHESLDTWVDDTIANVCGVTADCQVKERAAATIAGATAIRIVVSYTVTAESPGPNLYAPGQQLQELAYFVQKGSRGYIIDLTATTANFPQLLDRYEEVAKTFQFTS
jgi:hypothetical protein